MGVWGPGNFDNDVASDHLIDIFSDQWQRIEDVMSEPAELEADEPEADIVLADIELFCALAEYLGHCPITLPAEDVLAQWRHAYLAAWDRSIDDLDPDPDFKLDRRQTIDDTFGRLIALGRRQAGD